MVPKPKGPGERRATVQIAKAEYIKETKHFYCFMVTPTEFSGTETKQNARLKMLA